MPYSAYIWEPICEIEEWMIAEMFTNGISTVEMCFWMHEIQIANINNSYVHM